MILDCAISTRGNFLIQFKTKRSGILCRERKCLTRLKNAGEWCQKLVNKYSLYGSLWLFLVAVFIFIFASASLDLKIKLIHPQKS